ncbi:uncharacterized protein LOC141716883 isoform X2 [Apium graveolens]|uniref:uncharacterized protein LOC141716883 isoform X2 n=1 Tax=Apium graveolens TaxID=4045 RepID=UPI003D7B9D3C
MDTDNFPALMSQNEVLSPDEMKESPRRSEIDTEALADDDYIAAELDKVRNMTPQEADAAKSEAYVKARVAMSEAYDATFKVENVVSHVRAMLESVKKYSRTELEKIWSPQTPWEALKEAFERCEAATRELIAAQYTADKLIRLLNAISRACEKRPMVGKASSSCYT